MMRRKCKVATLSGSLRDPVDLNQFLTTSGVMSSVRVLVDPVNFNILSPFLNLICFR